MSLCELTSRTFKEFSLSSRACVSLGVFAFLHSCLSHCHQYLYILLKLLEMELKVVKEQIVFPMPMKADVLAGCQVDTDPKRKRDQKSFHLTCFENLCTH